MIFDHGEGRDAAEPVTMGPWDFGTAFSASQEARDQQDAARRERVTKNKELAEAERAYKRALAQEVLRQHAAGVNSWSACENIARGEEVVSQLRFERDLARGVYAAAEERAWRHQSDRKDVLEMIQWSRVANPSGA